ETRENGYLDPMKRSAGALAVLAPLFFAAPAARGQTPAFLPNVDASLAAAARPVPALAGPVGAVPLAFVASRHQRRGVPTFLWAIRGGAAAPALASAVAGVGPEAAARAHLAAHAPRYGLTPDALSTAFVARVLDVGRGGIVVVFRQRVGGVE